MSGNHLGVGKEGLIKMHFLSPITDPLRPKSYTHSSLRTTEVSVNQVKIIGPSGKPINHFRFTQQFYNEW